VPRGTTITIILAQPAADLLDDDLNAWDRRLILTVGNGNLDTSVDPGFSLGANDNLALLAPGPTRAFDDDRGIAFLAQDEVITPASFGVLSDGVLP
jgi:hypothetical protein